jgi:hypothetical protein
VLYSSRSLFTCSAQLTLYLLVTVMGWYLTKRRTYSYKVSSQLITADSTAVKASNLARYTFMRFMTLCQLHRYIIRVIINDSLENREESSPDDVKYNPAFM